MGGSASKTEVVIPVDRTDAAAAAADAAAAATAAAQREQQRAAAAVAYVDAEETLYHEGYKKGAHDALAKLDEEMARQARAAYASASVDDEKAAAAAVRQELDRLTRVQYRAPARGTQCGAEEAAVLACDPRDDKDRCAAVIKAYEACADAVTFKLMNPAAAGGDAVVKG